MFAFLLAIVYFILKLAGAPFPVGNPTIVILVTFFSGIQLLSLGVMGEYVGRIYDEVARATQVHRRVASWLRRPSRDALPPVCILAGGLGTGSVSWWRYAEAAARGRRRAVPDSSAATPCGERRDVSRPLRRYLGEQIEERIGRERFGIDIAYSYDGPGSRERSARFGVRCRCFPSASWCSTGTPICGSTTAPRSDAWNASGCAGLMTVFRNEGRWDTSNVVYRRRPRRRLRQGSADPGDALDRLRARRPRARALDLVDEGDDLSALARRLVARGELCGYEARPLLRDRNARGLAETEAFLEANRRGLALASAVNRYGRAGVSAVGQRRPNCRSTADRYRLV